MSNDQNYVALTQIERRMENEVSAFSMADSRLQNYLDFMEQSPTLQINGLLKAFSLLAARDERLGEYKSADAAYTWMNALCKGKRSKLYAHMFPTIIFKEAIVPQFLKEASWSHEIEVMESKEAWIMITLTTLVCMTVLALGVLVFHLNFFLCLVLVFALYFYFIFYYCYWYRQRSILLLLEKRREDMSPILQHFVYSLPLQEHPLYPSQKDRESLQKALWAKPKKQSQKEKQNQSLSQRKPTNKKSSSSSKIVSNNPKPSGSTSSRLSIFMEEEAKEREKEQKRLEEESRLKQVSEPTTTVKNNKTKPKSKRKSSRKKRPSPSLNLTRNRKSSSHKTTNRHFIQSMSASTPSASKQWH